MVCFLTGGNVRLVFVPKTENMLKTCTCLHSVCVGDGYVAFPLFCMYKQTAYIYINIRIYPCLCIYLFPDTLIAHSPSLWSQATSPSTGPGAAEWRGRSLQRWVRHSPIHCFIIHCSHFAARDSFLPGSHLESIECPFPDGPREVWEGKGEVAGERGVDGGEVWGMGA